RGRRDDRLRIVRVAQREPSGNRRAPCDQRPAEVPGGAPRLTLAALGRERLPRVERLVAHLQVHLVPPGVQPGPRDDLYARASGAHAVGTERILPDADGLDLLLRRQLAALEAVHAEL